jgi:hypothetical protein
MAKPLAVTWNDLPDIDQTEPFGAEDEPCLRELRQVLEKHGRTHRFGIALLHSHFPMTEGEMLLEHIDSANRVLRTEPVNESEVDTTRIKPTLVRFDDGVMMSCSYCPTGKDGRHAGYKEPC